MTKKHVAGVVFIGTVVRLRACFVRNWSWVTQICNSNFGVTVMEVMVKVCDEGRGNLSTTYRDSPISLVHLLSGAPQGWIFRVEIIFV